MSGEDTNTTIEYFGRESCRQLISVIEHFENLYNRKHQNYRSRIISNQSWRHISELMGRSIADCRKVWRLLRNHYNKVLRRNQQKQLLEGDVAELNIKPWQFEEQMQFLKPFLMPSRRSTCNLTADSETLDDSDAEEDPENMGSSLLGFHVEEQIQETETDEKPTTESLALHCQSIEQESISSFPKAQTVVYAMPCGVKPSLKRKFDETEQQPDEEGDLYFKSLACRFKTFTPMQQALCRIEMDKIEFGMHTAAAGSHERNCNYTEAMNSNYRLE